MEWKTDPIPIWIIQSGIKIMICIEGKSDIELAAFVKVGEGEVGVRDENAHQFCFDVYGQDYALSVCRWYVSTKEVEAWMLAPERYKATTGRQ